MIPNIPLPSPIPTSSPVSIAHVPFYSQLDIQSVKWRDVGCGVTSLAMIIDFYKPKVVTVDKLLMQAVARGAYDKKAGWKHKDLILLAKTYGLDGQSYDLGKITSKSAFATFKTHLTNGPIIASVHYKFDPKSTVPHMVVIDGIDNGFVYYNDPTSKVGGEQKISTADFLKGWKKRFIVIRPTPENIEIALR